MQVSPTFNRASAHWASLKHGYSGSPPAVDPKFAGFKMSFASRKFIATAFTRRSASANRKVIEYTRERLNRRETKRRGEGDYTYLFTLDKYWTLDGAFGGSGAKSSTIAVSLTWCPAS
jgi:hypothetical protein